MAEIDDLRARLEELDGVIEKGLALIRCGTSIFVAKEGAEAVVEIRTVLTNASTAYHIQGKRLPLFVEDLCKKYSV